MLRVRHDAAPKPVRIPDLRAWRWETGPGGSDLTGCYCSSWCVFRERSHRICTPVVPYKPWSTLPVYSTNAVQEVVGVFLLERSPPESFLRANHSDKVHEPRRKRVEGFLAAGRSFHACLLASVSALSKEAYAEIRLVKEEKQRKHRSFGKKDVP